MGEKGAKQSSAGADAAADLVDDLAPLGEVTSRKMFGGFGIFVEGIMFAIIDPMGTSYLRADETTAVEFAAAGSERHGRMPYWEIPADVRADTDALLRWASTSAAVARTAKK